MFNFLYFKNIMITIFFFLISLIKCQLISNYFYIEHIYLSNICFENNYISNFSINLDIRGKEIPKNIIIHELFKIILESKNNEKKKIIFICDLMGETIIENAYIQCILKKKNNTNLNDLFYFREEFFKKSFTIENQGKLLNFILDISNQTFLFGMIESFASKGNSFGYFIKYKNSNIIIPIAMSLDDRYIYTTIIAMTSIMENSYKSTNYEFYIMHPPEFSMENKIILKNMEKKYNRCSINLINMGLKFKTAKIKGRITTPAYYRLALAELLPNIDKIIYLDGDILAFVDLKEMYDLDMDGYYYKGYLDILQDSFNLDNDIYICSGVLLINLEELRKDDMLNKTYKFMEENRQRLLKEQYHDQPIINALCYRKIGILPPKFGIFAYPNLENLYDDITLYRNSKIYSKEELKDAYFYPKVLHFTRGKPWKLRNNFKLNLWWEYAKKTGYYEEICKTYNLCDNNKNNTKI